MGLSLKVTTSGALLSGKGPEVIQTNLDRFVEQATMFLLAEVKKRTPQGVFGAQGGLMGSIQTDVTGKGTPVIKGMVMTAQPYAEVVEKGRKPGKGVPIDAPGFQRWIEVKLGVTDPQELRRVAFVISRNIKRKGIEGRFMFERAVSENTSKLEQLARACGLKIAEDLGRNA